MQLKNGFAGVITGASTGIGKALAVLLAKRLKARLIINARTEAALADTKQLVESLGGKAVVVAGDMGEPSVPAQLIERCLAEFGELNLLVNNAGLAVPGAVRNLTTKDWERVFAVNFFGPLYATYAALPHFAANKPGKIVNISSVAGKVAFPGSVCYAASKFALTGMSEGMAAELESTGVDVITVCPGWVRTEFFVKNRMMPEKNPSEIAEQRNFKGMVMKHVLSISSEQAAQQIFEAIQKEGGREIVLTGPAVVIERFNALMPKVVFGLAKRIPMDLIDSSQK